VISRGISAASEHELGGAALVLGNGVVQSASDTRVAGDLLLAKMLERADLPAGVSQVVVGAGSEIGDYFVQHPALV
jgi:aldehyde dehydrogenase (NAD+)